MGRPQFRSVHQLRLEETDKHVVVKLWLNKDNVHAQTMKARLATQLQARSQQPVDHSQSSTLQSLARSRRTKADRHSSVRGTHRRQADSPVSSTVSSDDEATNHDQVASSGTTASSSSSDAESAISEPEPTPPRQRQASRRQRQAPAGPATMAVERTARARSPKSRRSRPPSATSILGDPC